jgi:hypothetical protein
MLTGALMKNIALLASVLSVGLVACSGASEDDSVTEGAVRGPSLEQARNVVKDFYGQWGPAMKDSYPALTAEANTKIAAAWDHARHEPYFADGGYENPFTGNDGHIGGGPIKVDAAQYAFGLNEAVMTVHSASPIGHDNLITVRVRLSDLKISDISLNIRECGTVEEGFLWSLVGTYDMKSSYPSASGGAGRVEVYWNENTKENCVVARCLERCGEKMSRSLKVRVDGADWVTDAGKFEWWAGPIKVKAPGRCIDVRASFGDEGVAGSTTFDNKHCG